MQRVRCKGCKALVEREGCLRYGLGYVCDATCAALISDRRIRSGMNALAPKPDHLGEFAPRRPGHDTPASLRVRVRTRDGNRCRWCGTSENLSVHHIVYRSECGPHAEMNLVTLCLGCHDRAHSDKGTYQPLLMELMRLLYDDGLFLSVPALQARLRLSG